MEEEEEKEGGRRGAGGGERLGSIDSGYCLTAYLRLICPRLGIRMQGRSNENYETHPRIFNSTLVIRPPLQPLSSAYRIAASAFSFDRLTKSSADTQALFSFLFPLNFCNSRQTFIMLQLLLRFS